MSDPITFAGAVCLQLGIDAVRQVAFALPIAFAFEFEKKAFWLRESVPPSAVEVAILITGLAAGSISVLMWPHEHIVGLPFAAAAAIASPVFAGAFMRHAGLMFRDLGQDPPSMFSMRDATIFALGISLMRVATSGLI
jgi:hypothetical protein